MQDSLRESTDRIYSRCALSKNQQKPHKRTQIVVGEVQSGKTSSFTALSALARDGNCPIVIVIAGTKSNLVTQTRDRLIEDLRIGSNAGFPEWELLHRPKARDIQKILPILLAWNDPKRSAEFRTSLLLVVLKSPAGLRNTKDLLLKIGETLDLTGHPVLVIDDEADQAGLNNKALRGGQSTVYSNILELRKAIPWHAYCMYTATPQANFLIDLIDELSPERVTVLNAGNDYLGGQTLFDGKFTYVVPIPQTELLVATNPSSTDSPPESLKASLAFFFLALAVSQKRRRPKPISMLVHASGLQSAHGVYEKWVKAIVQSWIVQLRDETEQSFLDLISKYLKPAISEYFKSGDGIDWPYRGKSKFDSLEIARDIKYLLSEIEIRVVNGASKSHTVEKDEWDRHPGWIVIGGNKLDRGFTIKELAVTYMPRSNSTNVDTLQQRGRFFGYKESYRDLLRGWFAASTEEMFTDYVIHEQDMRTRLKKLDEDETNIRDWRRSFLLPQGTQPTRSQVIGILSNRVNLEQGFIFSQRYLYDKSVAAGFSESLEKLTRFRSHAKFVDNDPRSLNGNESVSCTFEEIMRLLNDWISHGRDRSTLSRVSESLESIGDRNKFGGCIYFMDNLQLRQRGAAWDNDTSLPQRDWQVGNLFEGKKYSGTMYPGDTSMTAKHGITLQIHRVHPRELSDGHEVLALAIALGEEFNFYHLEQMLVH